MGIYIVISLDSQPVCADLYFPMGLPAGSSIDLCLAASSPSKSAKDDPRFALNYAYVNGRKVPVARNNYDHKYGATYLSRGISVRAPRVNGQRICQLKNLRLPVPSLAVSAETLSVPENVLGQTDQQGSTDAVASGALPRSKDAPPDVEMVFTEASQACAKAIDDIVSANEPETQTVFLCTQCSHQTFDKDVAVSHCKSHLKGPRPKAVSGAKSASVSSKLRYVCVHCGKKFVSNQRLQVHLLCHAESSAKPVQKESDPVVRPSGKEADLPFRCLYCTETYPTKASLEAHIKWCQPESPKAEIAASADADELESHILITKVPGEKSSLQCSDCGEQFADFNTFNAHHRLQDCAGGDRDQALSITTAKRKRREFACVHCDHVASSYARLCDHSVEHSEATLYRCNVCRKVFLHKAMLEQHALSHSQPDTTPQRLYPCCYCDRVFKSHRGIQAHTNFHKNVRPFECRECGASLSSKANLKAHMVSIHGDPGDDAKCPHCPKVFKLQRSLNIHLRAIHGPEKVHECQLCGKRLATERKLLKHQALVHFNDNTSAAAGAALSQSGQMSLLRLLTCPKCPFRTYSYPRLARHRVQHTGVYPHQCPECDKQFIFKDQVTRHVQSVHRKSRLTCPHCPRLFFSAKLHQLHLETHRQKQGFPCTSCGSYYETTAALEHHAQSHSPDLPFECSLCQRRFKFSQGLSVHLRFHHRGASASAGKGVGDHTWRHTCDVCHIRFKYQSSLAAHRLNKHTEAEKLTCTYCSRTFSSQCVLSLHIRSHTGEKPHVCPHCGRAFSIPANLKNHLVTQHTKDFKLFCPLCGKGAVSNLKLRQHLLLSHKAVGGTCKGAGRAAAALPAADQLDVPEMEDVPVPMTHVIVEDPASIFSQIVL